MIESLNIQQFGKRDTQKPYYPYPLAVESNILQDPKSLATPPVSSPGMDLMSGKIPNFDHRGLLELNNDTVVAFDHTAGEVYRRGVLLMTSSKSAVSTDGFILKEGMVTLIDADRGRLKIVHYIINIIEEPWRAEKMRREKRISKILGEIAFIRPGILDSPDYEITDIDFKSGIVIAEDRIPIFPLR